MKILHICALPATAKTLLVPQIKYLISQNLTVDIACAYGEEIKYLQEHGCKVYCIHFDRKISLLSNLKSIQELTKLIKNNQYDLVHVHTPIAAVLGRIAAKLAGVKRIVYTAHGFPFHDLSTPLQYTFYSKIEKLSAYLTDLILTQNYEDISTAIKLGLCPPEKIAYLGNGVDIKRFDSSSITVDSQNHLRASLNIPENTSFIIGTVGRLTRKKGSEYLVEAAAMLIHKFPNLHVLIIGGQLSTDSEPFHIQLLEKIRQLKIEKNITITGMRQDIPELLGLLDIFVLPTFTHEGLPRSIVEAMSMQLPVVTTDIRGCREAVVNGKTGFVVPHQNSHQLAQALENLLTQPQLRQMYGKAGRDRVENKYNEELVFERLINYYRELGIKI